MTFEEFSNNKKTVFSVTKCIEVVGEATKHVPNSIRRKNPRCSGEIWLESEIGFSLATLNQSEPGDRLDGCDCGISRASTHDGNGIV
jgi:hypothetical protein